MAARAWALRPAPAPGENSIRRLNTFVKISRRFPLGSENPERFPDAGKARDAVHEGMNKYQHQQVPGPEPEAG